MSSEENKVDDDKTMNTGLMIVSSVLVLVLIVLVFTWHSSSCSVEDCSNVADRLTYSDAVDKLESMLTDNSENQKIFIKNFFKQLKNTCVAKSS